MLEIIIGRAGTGKTFSCLQQMKKILSEEVFDTEIIFLLPAYQTYRAELELAKMTGGAVNTRMYSFQRFARQILSEVGGITLPRISEIGRRILLRKILLNHVKTDDLKYYSRAARQRSFAENLAQELKEFRTYNIDAEKIFAVLENVEDEELSNKLHDLAILFDDFRKSCEGKQNDESDLLEKAAAEIKNSVAIRRTEIFIDGFIFFDPQQRKILTELFKHAKNIHIALPMSANLNDAENTSRTGIFNRAFETFKMLKNLAEENKIEFKITRCEKSMRFESPALKFVEENFFKHSAKTFSGDIKDLKIIEAVNKRVEVEQTAREILNLRKKNYRFRDIGIISRDDSYNNLIKPIFEMHNIPYFADSKSAAIHHPLAELIRSALEIFRSWRAKPIFRALRTGFFDIEADKIDLLENYVIEFGLRGEKVWTQENIWSWHRHAVDISADETPASTEIQRLEEIDKIRRQSLEQIIKFSQGLKKKNSARFLTTELFNFLESLKVHDKLVEWSELEEKRGNLSLSKEHLKIWDDIIILFEQIVDALGDEELTAKDFETILNEGLDALEMSIIPPGLDEVTVSQFDQNSLQNLKAIFILGFDDKNFPKTATEKFLLSDADRLHLVEDCKIEIAKGGRETMLAEKFLVYRGLTLAKNFLQISSPLADVEGKAARPATMRDKFLKLFPDLKVDFAKLEILNSLGTEVEYTIGSREISAESAEKLFAPYKKMRGSVTRFESFNKCPFQYFAKYGLSLKARQEYKVIAADIGNILHAVMKKFGEDLKAEKKLWREVDNSELETRVTKIVEGFANNLNNKILLKTNAGKRRRERIKKIAISSLARLIELDKVSKFHPELFEKKFEELGTKNLVYDIHGVKMELTGTIDRVDFSEDGNYFMIIDYKTGTAELNLKEVFAGINLQLLTYLMVTSKLEKVADKLPAAMLYFFLKYPVKQKQSLAEAEKEVEDEIKPVGWFLEDKQIACALDQSNKILKFKFTAKGEFDKTFAKKNLQTAENFQALMKYVDDILQETGEKILQGFIKAEPYKLTKDICNYCDYSELCNFNAKIDKQRTIDIDDNEEILKQIKAHKTGWNFELTI